MPVECGLRLVRLAAYIAREGSLPGVDPAVDLVVGEPGEAAGAVGAAELLSVLPQLLPIASRRVLHRHLLTSLLDRPRHVSVISRVRISMCTHFSKFSACFVIIV